MSIKDLEEDNHYNRFFVRGIFLFFYIHCTEAIFDLITKYSEYNKKLFQSSP